MFIREEWHHELEKKLYIIKQYVNRNQISQSDMMLLLILLLEIVSSCSGFFLGKWKLPSTALHLSRFFLPQRLTFSGQWLHRFHLCKPLAVTLWILNNKCWHNKLNKLQITMLQTKGKVIKIPRCIGGVTHLCWVREERIENEGHSTDNTYWLDSHSVSGTGYKDERLAQNVSSRSHQLIRDKMKAPMG